MDINTLASPFRETLKNLATVNDRLMGPKLVVALVLLLTGVAMLIASLVLYTGM